MRKLTKNETLVLSTIHDLMREYRICKKHISISMHKDCIEFVHFAETEGEMLVSKSKMICFADKGEIINVNHYEGGKYTPPFWAVKLIKKFK